MTNGKSLLLLLAALAGVGCAARDATAQTGPSSPPYVRRGDEVEARYQAYRGHLEAFYEKLSKTIGESAPDLLPRLKPPEPVRHGYGILPPLAPDAPVPSERPRARSAWYSWPWTEELIRREVQTIEGLAAELRRIPAGVGGEPRAASERLASDYSRLRERQGTIDAHVQYNRFWQRAIAANTLGYDRETALHDAVLERQAILDARETSDEAAFRRALAGIRGIDSAKPWETLAIDLGEREKTLAREIHEATDRITPPSFLRVKEPGLRRRVLHVRFYTDIESDAFVRAFKAAVERSWHVRDDADEFGVELSITPLTARSSTGRGPSVLAETPPPASRPASASRSISNGTSPCSPRTARCSRPAPSPPT